MGKDGPPSSASARPSTSRRAATSRWPGSSARRRARARRRRDDLGRHRRRRHRQGARLLRGRDDAGAVPGRRARRAASRCSACTPPAPWAARPPSSPASSSRPGSTSACSPSCFEKQSESEAMWALSMPIPFQPPLHAGAGGYFAPHIRSYMRRSKAPDHIGILVALKDRLNALKNPYAHLHEHDITFDSIKDSMMLWDPIRYAETCPSSDGACAMVLASEDDADAATGAGRPGSRAPRCAASRPCRPSRDTGAPRAAAPRRRPTSTSRPGSPTPQARSTASRCTCRSRGSSRCGWRTSASPERRGLEVRRGRRHPARRRPAGEHVAAACCRRTRSAPAACSASPRRPCRCAARPASTRSTAPAPPSATPTAAARSSSPCGSSARTSRDRGTARRQGRHRHRRLARPGRGGGPPVRRRGRPGAPHRRARRRGSAVATDLGDAAAYRHLDVTDEDEWVAAVGGAEERFGPSPSWSTTPASSTSPDREAGRREVPPGRST